MVGNSILVKEVAYRKHRSTKAQSVSVEGEVVRVLIAGSELGVGGKAVIL